MSRTSFATVNWLFLAGVANNLWSWPNKKYFYKKPEIRKQVLHAPNIKKTLASTVCDCEKFLKLKFHRKHCVFPISNCQRRYVLVTNVRDSFVLSVSLSSQMVGKCHFVITIGRIEQEKQSWIWSWMGQEYLQS